MAGPKTKVARGRAIAGKSLSIAGGLLPGPAGMALGIAGKAVRGRGGGTGGASSPARRRGRRGLFMSKGRLFMGFSTKEVKNAMRKKYGGRKK